MHHICIIHMHHTHMHHTMHLCIILPKGDNVMNVLAHIGPFFCIKFHNSTPLHQPASAKPSKMSEPPDVLIQAIQWNDVQSELQGRTTFQSPIVTQEVLLESLRSTAHQLLTLTAEHTITKRNVNTLLSDNAILKEAVDTLNEQVNTLNTSLKSTNKRVEAAETYMKQAGDPEVLGALGGRVDEIEVHKEFIVQLGDLFGRFGHVETWQKGFVDVWNNHQEDYTATKAWVEETDVIVKDLKAKADEAMDMAELKQVLEALQAAAKESKDGLVAATDKLVQHDTDLEQRATLEAFQETKQVVDQHDKTFSQVTALAQGMTDKLEHASSEVERMAQRVDDNGKKVDEIFEGIQSGTLGGGIDAEEVDEKIEEKYSLIVDQLESAIRSATEDEDEFRRIANDLQDMVRKMQMGKADKREMAEVREKLMVDGRLREQVDTLRVLSDMKVSHDEAERMLQSKASRKELRSSLNRLTNDIGHVVDNKLNDFEEANAGPAMASADSLGPASSHGSFSLCLTCNHRLDKNDQLNKSNRGIAGRGKAMKNTSSPGGGDQFRSSHGLGAGLRNKPNITHMGPGGAALGGGFQVRSAASMHGNNNGSGSKRKQQFHNLPPEYSLPQIDPRLAKPATFVMGKDGRVYPGQRKQQLHTFNLGPRSQSTGDIARVEQPASGGGGGGGGSGGGSPLSKSAQSPFVTQVCFDGL
jgi:cell division septum initiation protein DivIVA